MGGRRNRRRSHSRGPNASHSDPSGNTDAPRSPTDPTSPLVVADSTMELASDEWISVTPKRVGRSSSSRSASADRGYAAAASTGLVGTQGPTVYSSTPRIDPEPALRSFFQPIVLAYGYRPSFVGPRVPTPLVSAGEVFDPILGYWYLVRGRPTPEHCSWFFYEYGDGPMGSATFGSKVNGVYWVNSGRTNLEPGEYPDSKKSYDPSCRIPIVYDHHLSVREAKSPPGQSDVSESESERGGRATSKVRFDVRNPGQRQRSQSRPRGPQTNQAKPKAKEQPKPQEPKKVKDPVDKKGDLSTMVDAAVASALSAQLGPIMAKLQALVPDDSKPKEPKKEKAPKKSKQPDPSPEVQGEVKLPSGPSIAQVPPPQSKPKATPVPKPLQRKSLSGGAHPTSVFGSSNALFRDLSDEEAATRFSKLKSFVPSQHFILCTGTWSADMSGDDFTVSCHFSYSPSPDEIGVWAAAGVIPQSRGPTPNPSQTDPSPIEPPAPPQEEPAASTSSSPPSIVIHPPSDPAGLPQRDAKAKKQKKESGDDAADVPTGFESVGGVWDSLPLDGESESTI